VPVSAAFGEEVIRQLEAQLGDKNKELEYAKLKIEALEQRLRQILIKKYGAASEKLSGAQLELLELEPGVSSEEVQAESEREAVAAPPAPPEAQTKSASGNRQNIQAARAFLHILHGWKRS
jgi:chromosome segregation ATPase